MNNVQIESVTNIPQEKLQEFLNEVMVVESSAWPKELQAERRKFESRFEIFPRGFLVAKINGKVKGVSTSQITYYDPSKIQTWNQTTDSGMIKNTHNPKGDSLYVVSIAVSQDVQGKGIGASLMERQKELARELGLKNLVLGARIPSYDSYCKENGSISVEDYLKLKNDRGEPVDPEIRFYMRQGLKPVKIVPDFEPDDASRNYGVVMVWDNPSQPS